MVVHVLKAMDTEVGDKNIKRENAFELSNWQKKN